MLKKIIGTVLALGLTAFAVAEDVTSPATADTQNIDVGSSDTGSIDDSMTDFMASIADVLSENDRSDDLADDSSDNGDNRRNDDRGNRHQTHLGLGFAYDTNKVYSYKTRQQVSQANNVANGKSKRSDRSKNDDDSDSDSDDDSDGDSDGCRGNGHKKGKGKGNKDCGDPSPSD